MIEIGEVLDLIQDKLENYKMTQALMASTDNLELKGFGRGAVEALENLMHEIREEFE